MRDSVIRLEATLQSPEESAAKLEIRDHITMTLEKNLQEMCVDIEAMWNILRDHYKVTDEDIIARVEKAEPVLRSAAEGVLLLCNECGRPNSFGPASLRKKCLYCAAELRTPKTMEIEDLSPLFIPPVFLMADNDSIRSSLSSYYTTGSKQTKNVQKFNELRLDHKTQEVLQHSKRLETHYRRMFPILSGFFHLLSEKDGVSAPAIIGAMLTKPPEKHPREGSFTYPYVLLSVLWRFISFETDLNVSYFQEEREKIKAQRSMRGFRDDLQKTDCPHCGRETSAIGQIICVCPYCGKRMRATTVADLFPARL